MNHLFLLISILFFCSACSKQENVSQISVPKHSIIGKWKSIDSVSESTSFSLDFRDNNLLVVELTTSNNKIETKDYIYKVVDDSTVDFYYANTPNEEKINISVKAENDSHLSLQCYRKDKPDIKVIIDPPILCFFHDFAKVSD